MDRTTLDCSFVEKDFYLKEFHGKSLLFALRATDLQTDTDRAVVEEVFRTLLLNQTRVIGLIETTGADDASQQVKTLAEKLAKVLGIPGVPLSQLSATVEDKQLLAQIWNVLRSIPLFIGLWPTNPSISLVACAQRVAANLQVYKLVLLDPSGGIAAGKHQLSFMNGPVLNEFLRQGEAEWAGLGFRRPLLEDVQSALEHGVASVTLCSVSNLDRELFTYEGCGTLFTLTDYCRVDRLGIDDFYEVEKLIQRGEREGYLKKRAPDEIAQLLLHGYGARLGLTPGALAGVCALLPYPEERAGEIAGLYTITRFQREGVGGRLVAKMIAEGQRRGLVYLFACTTQHGAQRLFERHGFCRVNSEAVPTKKWQGYEVQRRLQLVVYRRDLEESIANEKR